MMVYLFYFPSIMFLFSYHFLSWFPGVKYTVLVQSCTYLCSIIIIYHKRSSHDDLCPFTIEIHPLFSSHNRLNASSNCLVRTFHCNYVSCATWRPFSFPPQRLYVACSCTIQCSFPLYLAAQSRYPTICFCFSLLYAKPLIRGFAGIASCKVISCAICHTMADFIIFFVQQITDLSLDSVRC